jgi:hypothetical protein|tara:strand:- start:356 stop:613 length:258 start_codon:yes stop_codon:yes gene_type:complete
MPDNNDLQNRLVRLEQSLGLTTTNDDNNIQATDTTNTVLNWKALYKWLESEVEELIFDPNATPFVKSWATRLLENARAKIDRFTR